MKTTRSSDNWPNLGGGGGFSGGSVKNPNLTFLFKAFHKLT